jgi:hypothetical protein
MKEFWQFRKKKNHFTRKKHRFPTKIQIFPPKMLKLRISRQNKAITRRFSCRFPATLCSCRTRVISTPTFEPEISMGIVEPENGIETGS